MPRDERDWRQQLGKLLDDEKEGEEEVDPEIAKNLRIQSKKKKAREEEGEVVSIVNEEVVPIDGKEKYGGRTAEENDPLLFDEEVQAESAQELKPEEPSASVEPEQALPDAIASKDEKTIELNEKQILLFLDLLKYGAPDKKQSASIILAKHFGISVDELDSVLKLSDIPLSGGNPPAFVVNEKEIPEEGEGERATKTSPPTMKAEGEKPKEREDKKYVWYKGIENDLRFISSPSEVLSNDDFERRKEIAKKLRDKGVRLPILSTEKNDRVAFNNRNQLFAAVEYLNPIFTGPHKREAIKYLEGMNIGNGSGVECLPGSEEAKGKGVGGEEMTTREKVEIKDEDLPVYDDAIKVFLRGALFEEDNPEKAIDLFASLDRMGVRIYQLAKFIEGLEKEVQEKVWKEFKAVVMWWNMSEKERKNDNGSEKYPKIAEKAEVYARVLGME